MEKRFPVIMRPLYHPARLVQPAKLKKPSLIFAGSSGDMWGEWVPAIWIEKVLYVCSNLTPQHTYQFLTKNPKRYGQFILPNNCWYGTTCDGTNKTADNLFWLKESVSVKSIRFISFEPLLEIKGIDLRLDGIDWVIIGADSTRGAKKPPKEWADIIIEAARDKSIPVFIKNNYGYRDKIKEMPVQK